MIYGMMRCWECNFRFHIFRYYTVNKQIFKLFDKWSKLFSFKIFLEQSHMQIDRTGPLLYLWYRFHDKLKLHIFFNSHWPHSPPWVSEAIYITYKIDTKTRCIYESNDLPPFWEANWELKYSMKKSEEFVQLN